MFTLYKSGRTGRYYAQYSEDGKKVQFSCKTSNLKAARQFAISRLTGSHTTPEPQLSALTLSQFRQRYISAFAMALAPSTVKTYIVSFNQFIQFVGDVKIRDLTPEKCHQFIFADVRSLHTAAKHRRHLRRAFALAVRWDLLKSNPFDSVDRPRPIETKKDFFTPEEFQTFMDALPFVSFEERRFKRMVLLGRLSGMRASEMLHLKPEHIDFERQKILVVNTDTFRTKSRKNRSVPLPKQLAAILKDQIAEDAAKGLSEYVFSTLSGRPVSIQTLTEKFRELVRVALPQKKRLCVHSLRSTYITMAYIDGVPPQQIQLAVGHKTIRTTEEYAHLHAVPMDRLLTSLEANNAAYGI